MDFAAFDMQPCWAAPDTNLCTPSCQQNLYLLPQTCVSARAICLLHELRQRMPVLFRHPIIGRAPDKHVF